MSVKFRILRHAPHGEMASGGESRLKSYKTRGLNVEEVRRKREEEGVQLRKSKREEQVCSVLGLDLSSYQC